MPPLRIKLWLGFLRCIDRHITVVDAENADERAKKNSVLWKQSACSQHRRYLPKVSEFMVCERKAKEAPPYRTLVSGPRRKNLVFIVVHS